MRRLGVLTAVLLVCLVSSAGAVPPKQCAPETVKGTSYRVLVHGASCSFGRRAVKRYLLHKHSPAHYACTGGRGTNVAVNCQGSSKPAGDTVFRYVYGIKT